MKNVFFLYCLVTSFSVFSQEDAWVYFNTKVNAQYYYNNPLQMLSQRALDRRSTQGIALDIKDIPLHQPYIDQISEATGITVMAKSKWLNALHIRGTQTNIAALTSLSFVEKVVYANHSLNPSGRVASKTQKANKTDKFQEFKINFNYGTSATQVQMLNAHILHQQNHTGQGKIIAVMDSGFPGVDTTTPFQRLRDNNLILGGYNFVNDNANPYVGFQHGTQTLSNMGGYEDGQLIGTAPDAKYYLFVTEDYASENPIEESNWVEAAEMADSLGVDIISTSLGYYGYDNPNYSYTYSDMNGVTSFISQGASIAFTRGMICVTSAGNSGNSINPLNRYISAPADTANTLTVGAVNAVEVKTGFSSIGPSFDGRLKPDVMALGASATVAFETGVIGTNNGTSFSCPILAGGVASLWSAFPSKTNSEIVQLVKASSDRFSNPNNNYGYGIPDFQVAMNLALGTPEFNSNLVLNIYPNPTSDFIIVTSPDFLIGKQIKLYNNLGQLVQQTSIENKNQRISIQSLGTGIYFYNISSFEKTIQGKIIKQ
ncbi:S8 family serine peptidase [Flavobacterium sp.]|uniref:S8 family serine peptidase n=1 Tax=Flavobacterium sp. TaxID=239 RepID=UPI00286E95D8|nr:S8 family serine peptidase [Flavobacterium sp.]